MNELEEVWKFLSKNNLGDLFEKLVDKKIITLERLHKINRQNLKSYNLELEHSEEEDLLSALDDVFFSFYSHIFLN